MRITMKGGVWKNSEDEILKAAVMKYGLNNWSRVASLLVRKSTKQCKSRWYEWLDPAVKKTEWTRDEEEKLLHLAKLFPNQWRTIAPIVGRTAHQCLDHYDRLLDQAQGRTEEDRLNDPRRLRPGEIDPHPETKPSRADAVDMDDDEKEMLAEARARLANTRGKKAKRKAREKQLEEARRLAALQKRRELKASGISVGHWKRRNQTIDYAREIPFEQKPAKGFYPVGEDENPVVAKGVANFNLQQLEGKRRIDEERRLRKDDGRKLKRVMEGNLPEAIRLIERVNEPLPFHKRTKLTLQEPQLSEAELEEILALGKESNEVFPSSSSTHSSMLLTQSGQSTQPFPRFTPVRTPMMENTILLEAQNAVARMTASTPLEGGETPALHTVTPGVGVTPHHTVPRTPHPLATPHGRKSDIDGTGSEHKKRMQDSVIPTTPFSQVGETPATSFEEMSVGGRSPGRRDVVMQQLLRKQIKDSLAALPAPQNEVEVTLPETIGSTTPERLPEAEVIEDAEDVERRVKQEREEERLRQFKGESQAVQYGYPRPLNLDRLAVESTTDLEIGGNTLGEEEHLVQKAHDLVLRELKVLVEHDASTHPVAVPGLRITQIPTQKEDISLELLELSKDLVEKEKCALQKATGDDFNLSTSTELANAWEELESRELLLDPTSLTYVEEQEIPHNVKLKGFMALYEELKTYLTAETSKARKIEARLNTLTKGYILKNESLNKSIGDLFSEVLVLEADLKAFEKLAENEKKGLTMRVEELTMRQGQEKRFHRYLQTVFAELTAKRDQLEADIRHSHLTAQVTPHGVESFVCAS